MAEGEHGGAMREQGRAAREHGGAEGEQMDETVFSGGAKRRHLSQRAVTCWPGFGDTIYIYFVGGCVDGGTELIGIDWWEDVGMCLCKLCHESSLSRDLCGR